MLLPSLFTDIPCDPATMVVCAARDDFCHRLSDLKLRKLQHSEVHDLMSHSWSFYVNYEPLPPQQSVGFGVNAVFRGCIPFS